MKTKFKFNSLDDMLKSDEYNMYESDTLLNIQYHIINTDKNIDNMIEANNEGNFGCTHQEFI